MKKILTIIILYCSLSANYAQNGELHLDIGVSKLRANIFDYLDKDGYFYTKSSPMLSLKYQYVFKNHLGTYIDFSFTQQNFDTDKYYNFFKYKVLDDRTPIKCYATSIGIVYKTNISPKLNFEMNLGVGYNIMNRFHFEIDNLNNGPNYNNLYTFTALKCNGWVSNYNFNFSYLINKSNIFIKAGYQVVIYYQKLLKSVGIIDINSNKTNKFLIRNRVDFQSYNFYLGLYVKL